MRWLFVLLFPLLISSDGVLADSEDIFYVKKDGDFILGGLFSLHLRGHNENTCGMFESMPGYQFLQSMLYAIDRINNDTRILPNITLGTQIYDSCYSQVIGAGMTKKLIILTLVPPEQGQLVGVIGAHSSDLSKVVADFLRVFEIPQISYGSSASLLSDKSIYSYFFRTIPPDRQQAKALADICSALGWNYVIAINSDGLYGVKGMENFFTAARERHICIAQHLGLSAFPSQRDYDRLVRKLDSEPRARAVVMFVDVRDTRLILEALHRNRITRQFYWIGSDGWGNNINAIENYGKYAEGAITLTQHIMPVKGFSEYFNRLKLNEPMNRNNTWFREYWQIHFQCNLQDSPSTYPRNCTGNERLASNPPRLAPVQTVVNAVYAFAQALHNYMSHRCRGEDCKKVQVDRTILLRYLRNVSFTDQATGGKFEFDENNEISREYSVHNIQRDQGRFVYKHVGTWSEESKLDWDPTDLRWPTNESNPPLSICNDACAGGQYRQRRGSHDITCCWSCIACRSHEIVTTDGDTCSECPFGEVPDFNQSKCVSLSYVKALSQSSTQAILTVSMIGLLLVIITATIFFVNGNVALVKASSRELSGIILVGLALLFIFPWLLFLEPNVSLCVCQPIVLGVALSSCYAPLFMKILRIYRIFKTARKSAAKPILISPPSQVLIAVGLITVQILFSCISFFPTPPEPVTREINRGQSLFVECSMGKDVFATMLSYNMFLMLLCTIMAFKTRKFPRNFNEAKYIGFTMYFTCFVWIIFFPSYLSTGSGLGRIAWESGAVILVGWITLIGLFAPKIFHLVFLNHVSSNPEQLAVTTNTVSNVAVVSVNCPASTSLNRNKITVVVKSQVEAKPDVKDFDDNSDKEDETTSC